jgi:hypothetical protein
MEALTMRVIELDAKNWKSVMDFYLALLSAVGAPEWSGHGVAAALDALVWDGLTDIKPPYIIRIWNSALIPSNVVSEVLLLKRCLIEARNDCAALQERDIDINIEVIA